MSSGLGAARAARAGGLEGGECGKEESPRGAARSGSPGAFQKVSGSDLLSRAVSREVPSALEGLTSVFGMGTGVTPPT